MTTFNISSFTGPSPAAKGRWVCGDALDVIGDAAFAVSLDHGAVAMYDAGQMIGVIGRSLDFDSGRSCMVVERFAACDIAPLTVTIDDDAIISAAVSPARPAFLSLPAQRESDLLTISLVGQVVAGLG